MYDMAGAPHLLAVPALVSVPACGCSQLFSAICNRVSEVNLDVMCCSLGCAAATNEELSGFA